MKITSKERQQEWRAKHPGHYAEKDKKWRVEHPNYQREWRAKHPGRYAAEFKKWRAEHPNYQREWRAKNVAKDLFMCVKARAKKRKNFFSLTLSWVEKRLNAGICEQTGRAFEFERGDGLLNPRRNPWFPSVDRIDSSLGYTETNCQLVCSIYNFAKADWADADVLEMATWLLKNVKTKKEKKDE